MSISPLSASGTAGELQRELSPSATPDGLLLVIWNGDSSQGNHYQDLEQQLANHPRVHLHTIAELESLLSSAASPEKYAMVVAAGGDGTVHAVANHLLHSSRQIPLAIVPLGTGNDLCRSLEISLDPLAVCLALLQGEIKPRTIDVVELTLDQQQRYMLNVLSAGISASISQKIADDYKEVFGSFAYLTGMFQAFSEADSFHLHYQLNEGTPVPLECLNFFVANGRMCGGGIEISPHSQLVDGQLELVTYLPMDSVERARLMTDYLLGRYEEHPAVQIETFQSLSLESAELLPISLDGEICECRRVTAHILPQKLTILLPVLQQQAALQQQETAGEQQNLQPDEPQ